MAADEPNFIKNFFAGTVAGMVQVMVGQPFDTIKVRLQSQPSPPIYKGTMDVLRQTVQKEGAMALYKGTVAPLIGVGLCVSIQFAAVEQMKGLFRKPDGSRLTWSQYFLSGGVAGVANAIVAAPVEHIRTRLQVQTVKAGEKPMYLGPIDAVKKIYNQQGLARGIYKGMIPTMWREFFGYGFYFVTYEYAIYRNLVGTDLRVKDLNPAVVMGCGALGGTMMWALIFPLDVIKSKIQTDAFGAEGRYKSMIDVAQKVMKAEGVAGFYRGFTPCMLRASPVNACTFLAFETAMNFLGRD